MRIWKLSRSTALLCAAVVVSHWSASESVRRAAAQTAAATRAADQQFAAAAGLHNLKDFKLAAAEWAKFIQDFPRDKRISDARHYLGVCQLQTGDYAAAAATMEKLLATDPQFKEAAASQLYLGLAQFNAARGGKNELFAAAEKTLGTLVKNHPEGKHVAQALYYRAEALYADDKKQPAADLYRRVATEFDDDPLVPDALYALGVTLDELGRRDDAKAAYADFLERFAKHQLAVDVNVRRAELLVAEGKPEEAEALFAAAAATPGYDAADYALIRQAGCLYDRKLFAEAAARYDELPERFPRSQYRAVAALAAGKSAYNARDYAGAIARLAEFEGGDADARAEAAHWTVRALLKLNRAAEALAAVDAATKQAAASKFAAQLALDRADALYELAERRDEASAAYEQIAAKYAGDPVAPQAAYLAAFTALELGRNDQAHKSAAAFLKQYDRHALRNDVLYVDAEARLRDGKYAAAIEAYDDLLAAAPQHADRSQWIVRRALALSLAGRHADVIEALAKTVDQLQDDASAAEALHLLGLSRQATKDYGRAIDDFRAALARKPDRPQADETLLALAETQRSANDAAGARATLAKFLAAYPKSRLADTAAYRTAELAYDAGDLSAAESAYRRIIAEHPQSALAPHARYGLAWTLVGRGDAAGAAAAIDALLTGKVPAELQAKARYVRALANQQLKRYQPALADLADYLKTKPSGNDLADALYVQGLCEEGLDRNDAAVATFTRLLDVAPKYSGAPKVLYELGWLYKTANKPKESAAAFARLAAEHPKSELRAEALFHVGEEAYARKAYKEAIDAYFEASEQADSSELAEKAAHKLGWTYFHAGDFAKAEEWFRYQQQTYAAGPLAPDAAFMEAEAQFKQKKFKEALVSYRRVKDPQGTDFAVLTLLHAGQAAGQLEDWTQSLALLDEAAEKFPRSPYLPEITYERAWAKQNLGDEEAALKLYESVTEQTEREAAARARFMIGEIYFTRKNHAEAIRHFIKAAYVYAYPEWQARSHFEAGRCFEVLGKLDQARQSYREVVEKYPNQPDAELAKKRLSELGP